MRLNNISSLLGRPMTLCLGGILFRSVIFTCVRHTSRLFHLSLACLTSHWLSLKSFIRAVFLISYVSKLGIL